MDELAPGIYDWTARHERIGVIVHSHFLADGGVLIDPMGPPEGGLPGEPRVAILTTRHHLRHAPEYGVPILCHEAGLHEFAASGITVEPFAFGDEVAPGVRALEVGVLTPEETALHIAASGGWLALADAVIRHPDGNLGFVPDFLIGDDPEPIKKGMLDSLRRILAQEEFGGLLLAHGAPGTRSELEAFVAA